MNPSPPPVFAVAPLPPAEEPLPAEEAERIERWVGVSATVVVLLAGAAALLV